MAAVYWKVVSCHILPFQPILWNKCFPPEPANTAKHSPKSISQGGRLWQVWGGRGHAAVDRQVRREVRRRLPRRGVRRRRRRPSLRRSRFIKGGCSGNRVWWFTWYYRLFYYTMLPPSTAPPLRLHHPLMNTQACPPTSSPPASPSWSSTCGARGSAASWAARWSLGEWKGVCCKWVSNEFLECACIAFEQKSSQSLRYPFATSPFPFSQGIYIYIYIYTHTYILYKLQTLVPSKNAHLHVRDNSGKQ